jgi:hypothetical protein
MPDSFPPPSWGPAPFDERDLDAVLSGETADIPLALRPVADTLAVLRGAAPTPAELRGEAAAMAEYRALRLGQPGRPAGRAQTLEFPAVPDGRPPRRAARHRARRRPMPSVSRRAGALMGVAAAVLIGAVVVSGSLPGPIERITHLGRTSSAPPSASPSSGGNPQNTGATPTKPAVTADPTPTRSRVVPPSAPLPVPASKLCQEYYGNFMHPERVDWTAQRLLYKQLRKLADSSDPWRVFGYCEQYLSNVPHYDAPGTGPEGPGSKSEGKGPANAAKEKPSPAASPTPTAQGATGSSSGNGNSGSGQGSQGGGPASNS